MGGEGGAPWGAKQPVVHLSLSDPNGNPRTMPEGMGADFVAVRRQIETNDTRTG